MTHGPEDARLDGLDVARFAAFVGMVIVNFTIAMGAEGGGGLIGLVSTGLEGRAAAAFVVLAGTGLGLTALRGTMDQAVSVTVKRAAFLLVLGLLNMLIFDADILHYYAFYFLFGVFLLPLGTRALVFVIAALNVAFVIMILAFDYDAGWNWTDYTYEGFWTAEGFVRNLFFNGWHPIVPWLGFLLFGMILSRLPLGQRPTQIRMIGFGILAVVIAEGLGAGLRPLFASVDPELTVLATTEPVPPMPLYTLAGLGAASVVIGVCLRFSNAFERSGVLTIVTPAGRQALSLYVAHIVVGMGTLEALGMLGGQTPEAAMLAAVVFCIVAALWAFVWARFFKRGPVEALLRRVAG